MFRDEDGDMAKKAPKKKYTDQASLYAYPTLYYPTETFDIGNNTNIHEMAEEFSGSNWYLNENHDPINHPQHYTNHPSGVECIQITEWMGFCLGNAVKYIWRASLKGGLEDLRKAVWYLNREIERLEKSDNEDAETATTNGLPREDEIEGSSLPCD